MRRLFGLFGAGLLLWAQAAFAADPEARIRIGSISTTPGSSVSVPVHVTYTENGPDALTAMQFTVVYDSTVVEYMGYTVHSGMPSGWSVINVNPDYPISMTDGGGNKAVLHQIYGGAHGQWEGTEAHWMSINFMTTQVHCKLSPLHIARKCSPTQQVSFQLQTICPPEDAGPNETFDVLQDGEIWTTGCPGGCPKPPCEEIEP